MKNISLYIHIPFCKKSKCLYCDFVSFCQAENEIESYLASLEREMLFYKASLKGCRIKTIFIGGGTPSVLSNSQIKRLFSAIKNNFDLTHCCELTIECNPDSISESKLKTYKELGINRLSIGAQTMNDEILKSIGRRHDRQDFEKALSLSQKYFDNINVDMMLALPNQTLNDVKDMLAFLQTKGVSHISAYSLMIEQGTPFYALATQNKLPLPSEENSIKMYDFVAKYLKRHGYTRYEVSNFAKKGFECKHNINYWMCKEYLGLGCSAHSYICGKRFCNTSSLQEYIDRLSCNKSPVDSEEILTAQQRIEEYIMLSLRTKWGIDIDKFNSLFGFSLLDLKQKEIGMLKSQSLVKCTKRHLSLTSRGFHVLNSIVLALC